MPSASEPRQGVPSGLEASILAEQVRVLFQRAYLSVPTALTCAVLVIAVLWSEVSHRLLVPWLLTVVAITGTRIATVVTFNGRARSRLSPKSWASLFVLLTAFHGAAWGFAGVAFFPEAIVYQLFICFILGGLSAGASASTSSYPSAFLAFVIPALSPMAFQLLATGEKVYVAMASMLAVFGLAMGSICQAGGRTFVDSARLRFEASALRQEREALLSRYRAASEASLDAFFLLESVRAIDTGELLDFACVDLNSRAEELFGISRADALGRLIGEVFPYIRAYGTIQSYATVIATQKPIQDHREIDQGILAGRVIERQVTPLADGVAVTLRDVTKAKEAERKIHESLREKEILLREVHHRVKNNLQMISSLFNLQAEFIQDPRALEIFQDSIARVRAIATVHQRLYQSNDLAEVDAREYLRSLVTDLRRTFSGSDLALELVVDIEPLGMGIDTAIPCGLVVNELVTNAMKHAFRETKRGKIRIAGKKIGEDVLHIEVSDDGVGMPESIDFRKTQTLGLQLVCMLTKQMKGEVTLHRGGGTRFDLSMRLVPPSSAKSRSIKA